jgi:hypothetical protein
MYINHYTVEQGCPNFLGKRATAVIVGSFRGLTCQNHNKWYKLLAVCCTICIRHKYGRGMHDTK